MGPQEEEGTSETETGRPRLSSLAQDLPTLVGQEGKDWPWG